MRNLIVYTFLLLCTLSYSNKVKNEKTEDESQQIIEAYNNGDWNTIINICDGFIINNHPINDVRIIYAEALGATNQVSKGISVINEGIIEESDNYFYYKTLGVLYYINEDWEQAIKSFEKSIEIKPTYVRPYIHLAEIYSVIDQPEKAIQSYMMAIRIFSDYQKYDEVEQFSFEVLKIDSTYLDAYETLCYAFNSKENYESELSCILDYNKLAIEKNNKDHISISNFIMARVLYYLKQYDQSIEMFNYLLAFDNMNKETTILGYCFLSANFQKLENLSQANYYKQQALILDQDAETIINEILIN